MVGALARVLRLAIVSKSSLSSIPDASSAARRAALEGFGLPGPRRILGGAIQPPGMRFEDGY
jgi:hypothetical protein